MNTQEIAQEFLDTNAPDALLYRVQNQTGMDALQWLLDIVEEALDIAAYEDLEALKETYPEGDPYVSQLAEWMRLTGTWRWLSLILVRDRPPDMETLARCAQACVKSIIYAVVAEYLEEELNDRARFECYCDCGAEWYATERPGVCPECGSADLEIYDLEE